MNTYFTQDRIMKRFFFLVGKTKDTFCGECLDAVGLEWLLYTHLHELGFERILYYSKTQKIYCYDDVSYKLVLNPGLKAAPAPAPVNLIKGPMGGGLLGRLNQPVQVDSKENNTGILHFDKMNDMDAFTRIDGCMQDKKHRTAVVFTNAEDFFSFFGEVRTDRGSESVRSKIYDSMNNYDALGYDNGNIMLFIFPERSLSETLKVYEGVGGLWHTKFQPKLSKGQNVIEIGSPAQAEFRNAINYIRIKHGLAVELKDIEKISECFAKTAFAGHTTLSSWMSKLLLLAQQDQKLDLHRAEMICGITGKKSAMERLNELIGMQSVKEQIKTFVQRSAQNKKAVPHGDVSRIQPQPIALGRDVNLHFVLTGNPGTGKTTVAKLLGEIYYELGFLPSGHTVKVTRDDLVAGYIGQTAIKTKACIEQAMGGVLFIDEAYTLKRSAEGDDRDFGQEAIDTILEAMTDNMGQFSVIAAGYPKEMRAFLHSNPGLNRRFNDIIRIEDYQPDEMLQIFALTCQNRHFAVAENLQQALPDFMENWFRSRDENWGNAGYVESLVDGLYESWCRREGEKDEAGMPILTLADVPESLRVHLLDIEVAKKDAMQELNSLIGLSGVKERINDLRLAKAFDGNSLPGHYIFAGNPGTGKTTVARLMGDILCSVGALRRGHFVEVSREDLVSNHVGDTAIKTRRVIEKALDGMLFIDEAYRLYEGDDAHSNFGREAIDTLVAEMENHRANLCVICAGYTGPMEKFVQSNPGLKSRFEDPIVFEDYNADEMVQILKRFAQNEYTLTDCFIAGSHAVFQGWEQHKGEDFGNARDVRKYFEACKTNMRRRLVDTYGLPNIPEEEKRLLTEEDVAH